MYNASSAQYEDAIFYIYIYIYIYIHTAPIPEKLDVL